MSVFYSRRHNVGQKVLSGQLQAGMLIHLAYTNFACVWKIVSVEPRNAKGEIWIILVAPDSGKTKRTNAIYARHIRANESR
jgi:hypothetical protein